MKPTRIILSLLTSLSVLLSISLVGNGYAQTLDIQKLQHALAGPDREVTDFIRDPARKPVEVLAFLGIQPGMTVLDLYAAGGYYTYILSKAVEDSGLVYAQNTRRGRQFIEDRQNITQGEALDRKIEQAGLTNVVQITKPLDGIGLPVESLDGVIVAQVLHDYYNPNPERALDMLVTLKALLKPGGVIGITDHVGLDQFNNNELHRMTIDQAITIAEQAGFEVVVSDLLRVETDDHSRSIFDPRLNRTTDRFLLRLTKPR